MLSDRPVKSERSVRKAWQGAGDSGVDAVSSVFPSRVHRQRYYLKWAKHQESPKLPVFDGQSIFSPLYDGLQYVDCSLVLKAVESEIARITPSWDDIQFTELQYFRPLAERYNHYLSSINGKMDDLSKRSKMCEKSRKKSKETEERYDVGLNESLCGWEVDNARSVDLHQFLTWYRRQNLRNCSSRYRSPHLSSIMSKIMASNYLLPKTGAVDSKNATANEKQTKIVSNSKSACGDVSNKPKTSKVALKRKAPPTKKKQTVG